MGKRIEQGTGGQILTNFPLRIAMTGLTAANSMDKRSAVMKAKSAGVAWRDFPTIGFVLTLANGAKHQNS
jgi:hypothetical protein